MNVSFSDNKYIEFMRKIHELNVTKPEITKDENFSSDSVNPLPNGPYLNGGNYGGLINRMEIRLDVIYLVFDLYEEKNKIVEEAYKIFGDDLIASVSVSIKNKNIIYSGNVERSNGKTTKCIILNDFYSLDYFSLVKKQSDLNIGNSPFLLYNELYVPLVTNGRIDDIGTLRVFTDTDIFRKYFIGERGKPLKESILKGEVGVYFQFPRPRYRK